MDKPTLHWRATRLKGAVAMGGFLITADQAERAVLQSEEDAQSGKALSFEQARAEVRAINHLILPRSG